jgi:ribosomal-protein-alanine N-acetyltransferase
MNITPASNIDLSEITQWVISEKECQTWAGPLVNFPISIKKFIQEIEFSPKNSYVYKAGNEILAFGQIFDKEDYAHLARIITNPQKRGNGLGRKMCVHLINKASQLNKNGVSLNVYRDNSFAKNLYISLGFSEQPEGSTNEALFMVKT